MNRPLTTIPLPSAVLSTLRDHGFYYYEDVIDEKGIVKEAKDLLHQWKLDDIDIWRKITAPPATVSALDILQSECACPSIVTWSKELDDLLGGGVPIGSITELCGPPGCGKTQLSLQLCVDAQIPKCFGGLEGEAVFIDTASGFCPERLRDMAEACSRHCTALKKKPTLTKTLQHDIDSNKILKGVHCISVHGIYQLLAAIKLLPDLMNQHSEVRLVIIDSLAFPFVCGDSCSTIERTGYLYRILGDLQTMADERRLAVVVTNQLTTHLCGTLSEKKSELAPALGDSLGHRVNQRLVLGRISQDLHAAVLLKGHRSCKPSTAEACFRITSDGIRD